MDRGRGPIDPAGDPAALPGLPPSALAGADGLVLRRTSYQPWEEGYWRYLSDPVVLVADLRASRAPAETAGEAPGVRFVGGGVPRIFLRLRPRG